MKTALIIISILLLGISNINLKANPDTGNNINVCEEVDISQIAALLGWNQSQIETESMVSSSNQRNGVCRYVHGDEDLVIVVKERNKSQEKGGMGKSFGTVSDGSEKGGAKQTYELKNTVGDYQVEMNYGTEKNFADAYQLMEQIAALVNQL
ncbi:MAG: hypothetical protein CVV25_03180 [Ignavibacteriae bacterium HGW-Ignavibacteriae-4]|jgi:hypothetical protein|nr:MAG: hypothetical protein CVV25_03180 [Ignavibacteriae bacterium HGW-Ignavibacteriae-4]